MATDAGQEEGLRIALDSNDNPHIALKNMKEESLKHAYWDGSSWTIQHIDRMSIPSIAIDNSDHPHFSYGQTVDIEVDGKEDNGEIEGEVEGEIGEEREILKYAVIY